MLLLAQIGVASPPNPASAYRLRRIAGPLVTSIANPMTLGPRALAADTVFRQLTGQVIEYGTRTPIPAVQVEVVGTRRGALTDPEGRFRIKVPDTGQITVRAFLVGKCTWERTFQLDEDTTPLKVSLYRRPFNFEGPPTARIPEFAQPIDLSVSVDELRCAYERAEAAAGRGTLDLSGRSAVFNDLGGIVMAALRARGIRALANAERGDKPVSVAVDDAGLAGHRWEDAPFPVHFQRPREALRSLYVGDATTLLNVTLRDIATDRVSLVLHFYDAEYLKGGWHPLAYAYVDVVRRGDGWSGEVRDKDTRGRPN